MQFLDELCKVLLELVFVETLSAEKENLYTIFHSNFTLKYFSNALYNSSKNYSEK